MKKNILITGTSTGVGLESAVLFAKKGYKVYATMRNLEKAKDLNEKIKSENLNIEVLELDVTKNDTIQKVVKTIIKQDWKIDILLNNAGAWFAKTTENTSLEEIDWVTNVNYIGLVKTTKAVIPYMRRAKSWHIINISSVGGLVWQPFNELYCGAKFAVEGFSEGLASYLTPWFWIKVSVIEPGGISTEFMKNATIKTINEEWELASWEYAPLFQKYFEGIQKRASKNEVSVYQTGAEVAEIILKVAETENPPLRIRTSSWAENFCELKTKADPDGTKLMKQVGADML